MTPAQMLALAMLSGSPALLTLVAGHLLANRPAMALLAFYLPRETLAVLDRTLTNGGTDETGRRAADGVRPPPA